MDPSIRSTRTASRPVKRPRRRRTAAGELWAGRMSCSGHVCRGSLTVMVTASLVLRFTTLSPDSRVGYRKLRAMQSAATDDVRERVALPECKVRRAPEVPVFLVSGWIKAIGLRSDEHGWSMLDLIHEVEPSTSSPRPTRSPDDQYDTPRDHPDAAFRWLGFVAPEQCNLLGVTPY